jgi:hypothetical protein
MCDFVMVTVLNACMLIFLWEGRKPSGVGVYLCVCMGTGRVVSQKNNGTASTSIAATMMKVYQCSA